MNRKLFAVILIVLLLFSGALVCFAIQPPSPDSDTRLFYGSKPDQQTCLLIVDYVEALYNLRYFQFGDFILVGSPSGSSSLRIYVLRDDSVDPPVISSSGISFSGMSYFFTPAGFDLYSVSQANTASFSEILCYVDPSSGEFVDNSSNYSFGSASDSSFVSYVNDFLSFYDKVWNYDEYVSDAYDEGYVQGGADGYREAYNDGYSDGSFDGYETGYSDGLSTGLSQGFNQGKQAGLIQGREEGYETGFDDGYETGYTAGRSDGYFAGNSEGYQTGLIAGRAEGYDTGYADGLDAGYDTGFEDGFSEGYDTGFDDGYDFGFDDGLSQGGSGRLVNLRLFFKLPPDETKAEKMLYWDGSNTDSLEFMYATEATSQNLTLYYINQDFFESQIDAPSSINFDVPDIIQQKFGYNFGLFTQFNAVNQSAFIELYTSDYGIGFNNGFESGANILDGISDIAVAPVHGLMTALDFELFGINVGAVLIGLIAVFLALLGWKFIKKLIPV